MTGPMRSFFLTLMLSMASAFLYAQYQRLDSLERKLTSATNPSEQAQILGLIWEELETTDTKSALMAASKNRNLVYSVTTFSDNDRMDADNKLGITYMNLNQSDSALFYFQLVLNKAFEIGDSVYMSKAYNNMGALNGNLGNYTSAMYFMNKSAVIDEALHDFEGAVFGYINIGSIYSALHIGDSARYFLLEGLDASLRSKNNYLTATCYINLGFVEQYDKNFNLARGYFQSAYEMGRRDNNHDIMSSAYRNLAGVFQAEENYRAAIEYDLKSLEIADKGGLKKNSSQAHVGLAVSYEGIDDYKSALMHYKEYKLLTDSLRQSENTDQFIEMQEKYKSNQALRENEILIQKGRIKDLEIEKNNEEIANSRIIIISSVLGLVLLVVLAITLYNRNILKQRANMELQQANEIIQEKNNDILASIEYASKIQEALLPTKDNPNLFADSFFLLKPKDIVSGDFLWYSTVDNKRIVAAVDCTGHGVPGAFMSMIGNTFLHQIINERGLTKPDEILNELRAKVIRALNQKGEGVNRKDGMDMAICVFDKAAMTLEFAGANNPLFMVVDGQPREYKADKQPVGYFEGKEQPFTSHLIQVKPGDCFYILSDGYADQFGGPKGKKFKYKQLYDLLVRESKKPMSEQKKILVSTFDDWKGNLEQVDDVCFVGARI